MRRWMFRTQKWVKERLERLEVYMDPPTDETPRSDRSSVDEGPRKDDLSFSSSSSLSNNNNDELPRESSGGQRAQKRRQGSNEDEEVVSDSGASS